jgi:hypothetical protein
VAIATVDSGAEVRSIDHNSIVGLLNGTADTADATYAQPVKLYQFNNTGTYSLTVGNQDTTNGLIALFQYGPVGAATTVARITKAGLIANVYRSSGPVFELEAFAASPTAIRGATPTEDPDVAWAAAYAAVQAAGGGTILLGPHLYLCYSVNTPGPNNCTIRGAGMFATTVKRRASSVVPPIYFLGKTGSGACDLAVDDNYTNNTTSVSCAVSIDGPRCFAYRLYVHDFNLDGINCTGLDVIVQDCIIEGLAPVAYASTIPTTNYQSRYGIASASQVGYVIERAKIIGNTVTGTRSAAISIGGPNSIIALNTVKNCHRGDYGLVAGTSGGHIALTVASNGGVANDTLPSNCVIVGNHIGASAAIVGAGGAGGIEIDSCNQILVANNTINDVALFGISIGCSGGNTRDVMILGNTITSVNTVTGVPTSPTNGSCGIILNGTSAGSVYSNIGTVIQNNTITSCENAIFSVSIVSTYSFLGNVLTSNVRGWTKSDSATDWQSWGNSHVSGSHAPLPNKLYQSNATAFADGVAAYVGQFAQASATGHGLLVSIAGATASQTLLNAANANGVAFGVFGDGLVRIAGPANGQRLEIKTLTELKTLAVAAFSDTTIQKPAGAVILGVSARVTTTISGGGVTSFSVGDSGSATRFGTTATIALTAGTTDAGTAAGAYYNATAGAIRLTMNGGSPTAGVVRVTIHYYELTPATS